MARSLFHVPAFPYPCTPLRRIILASRRAPKICDPTNPITILYSLLLRARWAQKKPQTRGLHRALPVSPLTGGYFGQARDSDRREQNSRGWLSRGCFQRVLGWYACVDLPRIFTEIFYLIDKATCNFDHQSSRFPLPPSLISKGGVLHIRWTTRLMASTLRFAPDFWTTCFS